MPTVAVIVVDAVVHIIVVVLSMAVTVQHFTTNSVLLQRMHLFL